MNIQNLYQKYADGGAQRQEAPLTRADLEALVAQSLDYAPMLETLRRGYAEGGAVFGGSSGGSGLGGRQEGEYWVYDDGSRYYNGGPRNEDEEAIRMRSLLGAQGVASGKPAVISHTPSAYGYDVNYEPEYAARFWAQQPGGEPDWQTPTAAPTYAPAGNQAAWGGSQPANPPPTQPNGSTAPGPAGNGLGLPNLSGSTRYPYMPTTVYQTMPQMSAEGSWFPINYNPARINDLVAHLRSQMYA